MKKKLLTVAEVGRSAGVSIRTLQYYDEIGLLIADRSAKDYRLYAEQHLLRLQQILIERSLGRSLEDIRRSLDDPDFDQVANLKNQRRQMVEKLSETHRIIASIDSALEQYNSQKKEDQEMDHESLFDGFNPDEFEAEAKSRWEKTEAWSESKRRTKQYGESEWQELKEELVMIWTDAAKAMDSGETSDSVAALTLVERHRQHIDRWFYQLTREAHVALADMWVTDTRFSKNIDKHGEGLTVWFANAVREAAG